ncbi:hypothetical protein M8445_08445 [Deinococcus aquaticus]|uniref:YbjN domain-containing protein n=1 Tax=Deinococcus aquaticus TaxID=328692 RepID=A0ABY7UWY2_9DEIO|nr:hypothetical protein [Deinococcus aquaticus]WDA57402.1 hypothetical protein M8445_08445 [Deinococcus aquaticus]
MAEQRIAKVKPVRRAASAAGAIVMARKAGESGAGPEAAGLADLMAAQGFGVQVNPGVGLSFMFEGGQYFVPQQEQDSLFYHLLFPNFWELESDEEYGRALLACDAVNREAKLVKLHTVEGDVWAGIEALHDGPEAFMAFLPRYLGFVQDSVRAFRDVMLAPLDGEEDPEDDTAG